MPAGKFEWCPFNALCKRSNIIRIILFVCDFLCSCWYICWIWLIYIAVEHIIYQYVITVEKINFFLVKLTYFQGNFFHDHWSPQINKSNIFILSVQFYMEKNPRFPLHYIFLCFYWQKWIMVCRVFVTLNHRHNFPIAHTSIMKLQYSDPYASDPQC